MIRTFRSALDLFDLERDFIFRDTKRPVGALESVRKRQSECIALFHKSY